VEWVQRPLPSAIVGPTASDDITDDFSPAQDGPCEIRAGHSDVIPTSEIRMNSPDYLFASERSAWVHRAAFVRRRACLEASRTTGSWREWRRRRRSHWRSVWSSMGDRGREPFDGPDAGARSAPARSLFRRSRRARPAYAFGRTGACFPLALPSEGSRRGIAIETGQMDDKPVSSSDRISPLRWEKRACPACKIRTRTCEPDD